MKTEIANKYKIDFIDNNIIVAALAAIVEKEIKESKINCTVIESKPNT